ncbi:ferredoxin-type protein NapF [Rhodobium orientis]|uniref:Ferredoxin-type protein NapF n=1 Tax=Rhodobium orientis TaxID=34017 RepID=A0A327JP84_9HYPH|nr:ferredoxin-type protein NapF [Rhodobium orientis]MBB4301997.1 ferredoxin-type protein NapF [Rhodobium orientis]MBK5950234.1 ferredoxin-type protein NapF [Rhodobium orientis]RAI27164.1 ferredoxin-type protein NapF [Rhodobium orientis]
MPRTFSRRELFNRIGGTDAVLRPPFALQEDAFVECCTGCGRCIRACPQGILGAGRGNYPVLDFARGACTFCGACAEACTEGALGDPAGAPWRLRASVGDACLERSGIACRACEAWCEPRAIRFRPALGGRSEILIDPELCTGCGACIAPCPKGAIDVAAPANEEAAA